MAKNDKITDGWSDNFGIDDLYDMIPTPKKNCSKETNTFESKPFKKSPVNGREIRKGFYKKNPFGNNINTKMGT